MLSNGLKEYNKDGQAVKTVRVVSRATKDGELKTTQNGKTFGTVGVKAYGKQDGTAVFAEVKSFQSPWSRLIASFKKGETFEVSGRLEQREYNEKTYTDLLAESVIATERLAYLLIGNAAPATESGSQPAPQFTGAYLLDGEEEDGDLPF